MNFNGSYLPIAWNLEDNKYIETVYGSFDVIPVVFSMVLYVFKNESERFYPERRGRIIRFKHNDSGMFATIEKSLESSVMQSNGIMML